ncbi:MAG TPA: apolipoprotein N-acyltransferase [Pyrinomonadaceae bacterium]|nr:apolipoprotein N-acyltransferase [Pyrinomonadaceae bacterium]
MLAASALILSFPNFNLWFLAWAGFVPVFLLVARRRASWQSFFFGWLFGSVFFYGTCYWLTYSMINFGGFAAWQAFAMLIPGAIVLGIFPALFAMVLASSIRKWGTAALLLAPIIWAAMEWARLGITGQLWNAIGYSQAYHPLLIQPARLGGVYVVGFLIVAVNAAITFALIQRTFKPIAISGTLLVLVSSLILLMGSQSSSQHDTQRLAEAVVVAIQPNVPMDLIKSTEDMTKLNVRHFEMSEAALRSLPDNGLPRLLIWPESPMNFTYGSDAAFREKLKQFAKQHRTSVLLNSQEVAPNDGLYNSALLVNEEGSLVSQYDKIRLLPFGEYVPLPQWLPGAGLIRGIVGNFTPGTTYRLMSVGNVRAGVFICIESAYPNIARQFANDGADVLINISNDGYLGPTAVMRQHLANAVFRAVENNRPVLRVTNTGITALIPPSGDVRDVTQPFQQDVRVWHITRTSSPRSFYTAYGDVFAAVCAALTVLVFLLSFKKPARK